MHNIIIELGVLVLLIFIGVAFRQLFCGRLCPFGAIQDFLYKIPFPVKIKTFKGDKFFRYLKYVILIAFVFVLLILRPPEELSLQEINLWLFLGIFFILAVIIMVSIIIYRPFCKYMCPFGAIYSVFNSIPFLKYYVDERKCTKCGICVKACKMNVEPYKTPNHLECIRCGDCIKACPKKAITSGFRKKQSMVRNQTVSTSGA